MAFEHEYCHRLIATKDLLRLHITKEHPGVAGSELLPQRIRRFAMLAEKIFVNEPLDTEGIAKRKDKPSRPKPTKSVKALAGGMSKNVGKRK